MKSVQISRHRRHPWPRRMVSEDGSKLAQVGGWTGPLTGLTHRWPMNDANVTGTSILDVVGTLHGTAVGGVTSAAGPTTQARAFDGVTGLITLPNSPLTVAGPWTIGVWTFWPDITLQPDGGANPPRFFNFSDGVNAVCAVNNNIILAGQVDLSVNGTTGTMTTAVALINNTWQQLIFDFDGTATYTISLNGSVVATGATNGSFTAAVNQIAARNSDRRMTGRQAGLVTYNRKLLPAEKTQLFSAGQ